MSILLDAEKLRRKLEKLDAKRVEAINAVNLKINEARAKLMSEAPPAVLALVHASENLTETSDSRIEKHLDQIESTIEEFRKELAQ